MKAVSALMLLYVSVAAAGPRTVIEEFNARTKASEQVCKIQSTLQDPDFCEKCEPYLKWFRTQDCAELFSESPPAWAKKLGAKDWLPVCSPMMLKEKQTAEDVAAMTKFLHELDTCDKTQETTDFNRYSKNYKAPSQEDMGLRPMTDEEFSAYDIAVKEAMAKYQKSCCGEDKACNDMMKKVQPIYCEPMRSSKKSDECINADQFLTQTPDNFFKLGEDPGVMLLTVYTDVETGKPYIDVQDLLSHEMGHACSHAQLKVAVLKNDTDAIRALKDARKSDCGVNEAAIKRYQSLSRKREYSSETSDCLVKLAKSSSKTRFVEGACEAFCEVVSLEESYATAFAMSAEKTAAELIPIQIPKSLCESFRDSGHAFSADVLTCMLQTPAFRGRLESILECKK